MPQGQRDRHPDVAVQEGLTRRAGSRVVVHVRPLDLRAVTLGRRVVDHQQQPHGERQGLEEQQGQPRRNRFDLAAHAPQEVIIVLVVVADTGRSQPSGDGAAPAAEQHPVSTTPSRQRLRACNPADSHAYHSAKSWGECQRHRESTILGSSFVRRP